MTFGHLAGALHEVLVALGGTPRVWRTDRMATVVIPGTDRLNPQFAQLAKHYGVEVAVCPPHRPQRKGVVEAAIKFIGGRLVAHRRGRDDRRGPGVARPLVAAGTADAAPARVGRSASSAPRSRCGRCRRWRYPAEIVGRAQVARASALVAFEGNRYSVPPGHAGRTVERPRPRRRAAPADLLAGRRRWSRRTAAPRPAPGRRSAAAEHAGLLEQAVLAAFTTQTDACRRKANRPPGETALAELARLRGLDRRPAPVISLERYAALAEVAC